MVPDDTSVHSYVDHTLTVYHRYPHNMECPPYTASHTLFFHKGTSSSLPLDRSHRVPYDRLVHTHGSHMTVPAHTAYHTATLGWHRVSLTWSCHTDKAEYWSLDRADTLLDDMLADTCADHMTISYHRFLHTPTSWHYISSPLELRYHSNMGTSLSLDKGDNYQDDKVANKCVHSLVSVFSHKSDHMNGEPTKDRTEALQLYHRNTGIE